MESFFHSFDCHDIPVIDCTLVAILGAEFALKFFITIASMPVNSSLHLLSDLAIQGKKTVGRRQQGGFKGNKDKQFKTKIYKKVS